MCPQRRIVYLGTKVVLVAKQVQNCSRLESVEPLEFDDRNSVALQTISETRSRWVGSNPRKREIWQHKTTDPASAPTLNLRFLWISTQFDYLWNGNARAPLLFEWLAAAFFLRTICTKSAASWTPPASTTTCQSPCCSTLFGARCKSSRPPKFRAPPRGLFPFSAARLRQYISDGKEISVPDPKLQKKDQSPQVQSVMYVHIFVPTFRKSVLDAHRCVVRGRIKLRRKVLSLAHPTVG